MGVGEGGFSGITPCLRRMSFLNIKISKCVCDCAMGDDEPFCVGIGVVDGDLDGHIWHLHGCGWVCEVCAKGESM
jgi:hypothetical protein